MVTWSLRGYSNWLQKVNDLCALSICWTHSVILHSLQFHCWVAVIFSCFHFVIFNSPFVFPILPFHSCLFVIWCVCVKSSVWPPLTDFVYTITISCLRSFNMVAFPESRSRLQGWHPVIWADQLQNYVTDTNGCQSSQWVSLKLFIFAQNIAFSMEWGFCFLSLQLHLKMLISSKCSKHVLIIEIILG